MALGDARTMFIKKIGGWISQDDRRTIIRSALAKTFVRYAVVDSTEGRFAVDTADDVVSWWLINHGHWEYHETEIVKKILRENDTFVNVGANMGWYAVVADHAVAPHGRVIAIEPDTHNLELLRINLKLNECQRTHVEPVAVYDSKAVLFNRSETNYGDHHIVLESEAPVASERVAVKRLDELLGGENAVRLITIDAQGAEPGILRSGAESLRRTDFLITEFWPQGLRRLHSSVAAMAQALPPEFDRFSEIYDRAFDWHWQSVRDLVATLERRARELGDAATNLIFSRSALLQEGGLPK